MTFLNNVISNIVNILQGMEHFWFIRIIYPPPPLRENGICTSTFLNFNIDPLNEKITVLLCGLPRRCSTVVLGLFCFFYYHAIQARGQECRSGRANRNGLTCRGIREYRTPDRGWTKSWSQGVSKSKTLQLDDNTRLQVHILRPL